MGSLPIFVENIPGVVWSLIVAGIYASSTLALGTRLAPPCRTGWEGFDVAVRFALGAAAFGMLFTVLAMAQMAYAPLILTLALLPQALAVYRLRERVRLFSVLTPLHQSFHEWSAAHYSAVFGIVLLAAYPLAQSLAWPRGSDMTIYHLVIPRTVLWNHGLVFNPFSHDAGLFYGWQLYALPAYLMGGDRAFQLCSFFALSIILLSCYRVFRARYSPLTGLLGTLIVVATICGMSRESVVNNDVPLLLVEIALFSLACVAVQGRNLAVLLGLLGGFAIAIKLISVASVALAFAIFLSLSEKPLRLKQISVLGAGTLISLGPWPLFNYLASGSPIPHFLLLWPPDTGYLPHFRESITYLMQNFGDWYQKNFIRFFSKGLEFVPALLCGGLFMPFVRNARADPLCLTLVTLAFLKFLLLLALNRFDIAIIYHDRYHLTSYLMLIISGMLGWLHSIRPALVSRPWLKTVVLPALILIGTLHLYRTNVSAVQVNGEGLPDTATTYPSLKRGFYSAMGRLAERPGGGAGGVAYDFAAEQLPPNAVVATTVIDPYLLQRPFLQMLPVSENVIDLSLAPEQLHKALLAQGATHLHLAEHSGLNPWMVPVLDRWLVSLRKVPQLPGVRRMLYLNYPTQKGWQGFYELAPVAHDISGFSRLSDVRLTQERDGTWVLHWQANPGGDVKVNLHSGRGKAVPLGEAASEIGQFPIRLDLPASVTLEVICLVGGREVQVVNLAVPSTQH